MPPSRHSSSSHSSGSSRSFSSRSSFSRSSGSSYRSPSAHSSSSSRSALGAGLRGPTAHAASSMGAAAGAAMGAAGKRQNALDSRPRKNQPTGFSAATRLKPTYYCGRRHSYAYYPVAWTDAETGAHYEKGYYDEDGRRYDSVTFEENGRYKNVVCHCPYCGQETILDLGAGDVAAKSLSCPHCGGPMELRSELDAILNDAPPNTHVYASEASLKNAFPQKKKRKKRGWIVALVLLLLYGYGRKLLNEEAELPSPGGQIQQISVVQSGGQTVPKGDNVFLEKQADGSYHVVTDVVRADKILYFDRDADSYYDEASDCWLWYNTDVSPAVWQYWYEGISSDYGDYGWMEHDSSGWHIEKAQGQWVPLPEKYGTDGLWYIG